LADNEYDFQEMYYQEDGYGWEDYITKFVNYSDFSTIDLRNSKIKKDWVGACVAVALAQKATLPDSSKQWKIWGSN